MVLQAFTSSRNEMSLCPSKCLSEMYGFVCFRDLKIENLLLDEDNNIKLIGMALLFLRLPLKCRAPDY